MSEEERGAFQKNIFERAEHAINGEKIKIFGQKFFEILDQYV